MEIVQPSDSSSGANVTSLNGLTGAVVLAAGTNITLPTIGNTITINSTGGGGTPAGSDTQVQFNNSGSFGGMKLDYTEPTSTSVDLQFEDSITTDTQGLDVFIRGSSGDGSGRAGTLYITGGDSIDGQGADVGMFGGDSNSAIGGTLYLVGGNSATGDGGNITIQSGSGNNQGIISLNGHVFDLPTSGSYTYTYQTSSGTLAFLSDIPSVVSQATILIRGLGA